MTKNPFISGLWDLWCISSVIGLWPRFIEPRLLFNTNLCLKIKDLPQDLHGLKILHFSDLHFDNKMPKYFLEKVKRKILRLKPDLILFTGDLISYSQITKKKLLHDFLSSLHAPYGCFATLGNHDYTQYVSRNNDGNYDVSEGGYHFLVKVFKKKKNPSPVTTESAKRVKPMEELLSLYKETGFQLLENETKQISIKNTALNIVGLGDYWLERCKPDIAFKDYDSQFPGIVLSHNPDTLRLLKSYPGQLLLCGHTHGGQVNLPFLSDSFIGVKNLKFKRGLHTIEDKMLYVTRGVGSHDRFRWFSSPELVLITLQGTSS